jgi:hypothetical protein
VVVVVDGAGSVGAGGTGGASGSVSAGGASVGTNGGGVSSCLTFFFALLFLFLFFLSLGKIQPPVDDIAGSR